MQPQLRNLGRDGSVLTAAESGALGFTKRSPTPKAPCLAVLVALFSTSVCMDRVDWSYAPGPGALVLELPHLWEQPCVNSAEVPKWLVLLAKLVGGPDSRALADVFTDSMESCRKFSHVALLPKIPQSIVK